MRPCVAWPTPPTSKPLPSARLHQRQAHPRQLLRLAQARVRGQAEPLPHSGAAVERTPPLIRSVRALRLVQDRRLDVQLRVIRPGGVLRNFTATNPAGVPELPAARAVMAGAHDRCAPLGTAEHLVAPAITRRFDLRGLALRAAPRRARGCSSRARFAAARSPACIS